MPVRVESEEDLKRIHREGVGFVYNDNWVTIHSAACSGVGRMQVYTGDVAVYEYPGSKFFDLDLNLLVAWLKNEWLVGNRDTIKYCSNCEPQGRGSSPPQPPSMSPDPDDDSSSSALE
jgi:hypothetical protein